MGNDQSRRHRGRSRTGDSDSVSSGPGRRVGGGGGLDLGDLERLAADGAEIAITVGKAGLEKTREFSQQKEVEDVREQIIELSQKLVRDYQKSKDAAAS